LRLSAALHSLCIKLHQHINEPINRPEERKLLQEQVALFVEGALRQTTPGRAFTLGVIAGLPLTALGAFLTRWIPGGPLVLTTDVILLALSVRVLLACPSSPSRRSSGTSRRSPTGRSASTPASIRLAHAR